MQAIDALRKILTKARLCASVSLDPGLHCAGGISISWEAMPLVGEV
jgi:hypothetical protein